MTSSDPHAYGRSRASSERALVTALLLTTGFALVEVIAGRLSGSLAGHVTLRPGLRGEVVVVAMPDGRGQGDGKE